MAEVPSARQLSTPRTQTESASHLTAIRKTRTIDVKKKQGMVARALLMISQMENKCYAA